MAIAYIDAIVVFCEINIFHITITANTLSHFSTSFKKQFGCTPSEYSKKKYCLRFSLEPPLFKTYFIYYTAICNRFNQKKPILISPIQNNSRHLIVLTHTKA